MRPPDRIDTPRPPPPRHTDPVPADRLTAAQEKALAQRYAPILYFHPDEKNFLQDPNTYISESSLRKERDFWPDKEVHPVGQVPPGELARIGPENDHADAQLFLDHGDSKTERAGNLANSKNLYQYDASTNTLTYHFFYSYNDGPPGKVGDRQNHEGDWERITVQLDDQYQPVEVRYAAHDGLDIARPWSQAPSEDGRPVVYVGQGSHASYPQTGEWSTGLPGVNDQAVSTGLRFDTAGQPAVDVRTEPWYGSHVMWGERGTLQEADNPVVDTGFTSGPTGPSPEKGAVNPDADASRQPLDPNRDRNGWWPGNSGWWPF